MPKEVKIEIEAEPTEDMFGPEVAEAEAADSALFTEVSPKGRFSSKGLNPLVKAANMLLPVFGQEGNYPEFTTGSYEVWPEDFVRIMSMFSAASRDAAMEDVVPPELAFSLDGVVDDRDLNMLAGKIQGLAKSKDFKRWLKEKPEEEEPEPVNDVVPDEDEMSEDDIDDLFASRL